jgi:hypothetical protein
MHKSVAEVDQMAVRAPPSLFFTIIHPHLLFTLASVDNSSNSESDAPFNFYVVAFAGSEVIFTDREILM